MTERHWWDELADAATAAGHAAFSADWYAALRDAYFWRFPQADARSLRNMELLAEWAAQ